MNFVNDTDMQNPARDTIKPIDNSNDPDSQFPHQLISGLDDMTNLKHPNTPNTHNIANPTARRRKLQRFFPNHFSIKRVANNPSSRPKLFQRTSSNRIHHLSRRSFAFCWPALPIKKSMKPPNPLADPPATTMGHKTFVTISIIDRFPSGAVVVAGYRLPSFSINYIQQW